MQRKYVDTERVFAKENLELGQFFQDVTSKMRELQAREVALHAAAAARVQEVRGACSAVLIRAQVRVATQACSIVLCAGEADQ